MGSAATLRLLVDTGSAGGASERVGSTACRPTRTEDDTEQCILPEPASAPPEGCQRADVWGRVLNAASHRPSTWSAACIVWRAEGRHKAGHLLGNDEPASEGCEGCTRAAPLLWRRGSLPCSLVYPASPQDSET